MIDNKWYEKYTQERTPDKERISQIIQELIGPGRSAAKFAKMVDITPAMISRIINGKYANPLSVDILIKLASDDRQTMEILLEANGMVSPNQKSALRRLGHYGRLLYSMDREKIMRPILVNELFERGTLMRKIPFLDSNLHFEESSTEFNDVIRTDFAVEIHDTDGTYEWHFLLMPDQYGYDDVDISPSHNTKMLIQLLYPIFLQDAWEPDSFHNKKISFVFSDQEHFDFFVRYISEKTLHNRMSAILVDPEVDKVVKEVAFACDYQNVSSPFDKPETPDNQEEPGAYFGPDQ